jgi:hypothetical protein
MYIYIYKINDGLGIIICIFYLRIQKFYLNVQKDFK